MKKTYMQPIADVLTIAVESELLQSTVTFTGETGKSVLDPDTPSPQGDALVRMFMFAE